MSVTSAYVSARAVSKDRLRRKRKRLLGLSFSSPLQLCFFMWFTHGNLSSHVFAFACNYTWALAMWSSSADKKPCTHRPKLTNRRSESIRGIASSIVALFACGGLFRSRQARSQCSKKCKMLSSSARKMPGVHSRMQWKVKFRICICRVFVVCLFPFCVQGKCCLFPRRSVHVSSGDVFDLMPLTFCR